MKIALFDTDSVDIDRFFVKPLEIRSECSLVIIEDPIQYKLYLSFGVLRGETDIVCGSWMSINKLKNLFIEKNIDVLFINAHRIIDIWVILAARKAGVKISYIQHGMYIPFMKRNITFFLKKTIKTFRYFYYTLLISNEIKDISIIYKLFSIHLFGMSRNCLNKYHLFFPDKAGYFSEYWKNWHNEFYSFNIKKYIITGSTDFRLFTFKDHLLKNSVCYCYQTLVEDGRISNSLMKDFYYKLYEWSIINNKAIIVKAHPRADIANLNYLSNFGFKIEFNNVPNTEIVIGHYSTLLALWGLHSRKVLCVNLPEHEIHNSISTWSHVEDDLIPAKSIRCSDTNKCQYYFGNKLDSEILKSFLTEF